MRKNLDFIGLFNSHNFKYFHTENLMQNNLYYKGLVNKSMQFKVLVLLHKQM